MELKDIKGILLKQKAVKENDLMLTIATDLMGTISVYAKGAKKMNTRLSGISPYCLMDLELKELDEDLYVATYAKKSVDFFDITKDLESVSYANYILSLSADLFLPNEPFVELLKLVLNTLYLLTNSKKNKELIKCVFELRSLFMSGYEIDFSYCVNCQSEKASYIDLTNGVCLCENCGQNIAGLYPLNKALLDTLCHISSANDKTLFSFHLSDENIRSLSRISTDYVKIMMEKQYSSLEYLRKIQKNIGDVKNVKGN